MLSIFELFAAIATDAPHLLADAVKLYNDVAHGEGGAAKVTAAAGDAEKLVVDAAGAATGAAAAQ